MLALTYGQDGTVNIVAKPFDDQCILSALAKAEDALQPRSNEQDRVLAAGARRWLYKFVCLIGTRAFPIPPGRSEEDRNHFNICPLIVLTEEMNRHGKEIEQSL